MTSRRALLTLLALWPVTARADGPLAPEPISVRPFDPAVYAPAGPLPAGFKPVRLVDCNGAPGRVDVHQMSQTCMRLEPGFVAEYTSDWQAGLSAVDVRVTAEPLASERRDRDWLRVLWRRVHGRGASGRELARWGARTWRGDDGRVAEWGGFSTCCGGDRLTYVTRYVERDGYVIRIELRLYDYGPAEFARLRQLFVDGPVGAPPP